MLQTLITGSPSAYAMKKICYLTLAYFLISVSGIFKSVPSRVLSRKNCCEGFVPSILFVPFFARDNTEKTTKCWWTTSEYHYREKIPKWKKLLCFLCSSNPNLFSFQWLFVGKRFKSHATLPFFRLLWTKSTTVLSYANRVSKSWPRTLSELDAFSSKEAYICRKAGSRCAYKKLAQSFIPEQHFFSYEKGYFPLAVLSWNRLT